MASSIDANLADWSATEASNSPAGTDTADLDADLRRLQAAVRKYMRSPATPLASATTVDLATADGDYVSVTGTTTITGLGTVSAGMRFILVFAGALTFTHNATSLILPGGSNITTAAGDVAWMESLGSGNWKCLVYMPAAGYQGKDAELTALAGLTSAANKIPMFSGSGTATVIDFLDEDAMTSNSATAVPSQQSVKAYVDIAASTTVAGKVELATAAETQAVTDPARAVTPLSLASLVPKAWVVFDGTTNTAGDCDISGSFNVSSVTDNGTGDYTINFTNTLPDANYVVLITTSGAAGSAYTGFLESGATATKTTDAVRIRSAFANASSNNYIDAVSVNVLIFGA